MHIINTPYRPREHRAYTHNARTLLLMMTAYSIAMSVFHSQSAGERTLALRFAEGEWGWNSFAKADRGNYRVTGDLFGG